MQLQEELQIRKQRGAQIAKEGRVILRGHKWIVPSQNTTKKYEVKLLMNKQTCSCLDYQLRERKYKHIFAVEMTVERQIDSQGNVTFSKRITYSQKWSAYDKSQQEEKARFLELLSDLIQDVEEPSYTFGRPRIPIRDLLFASGLKVYTQFSLRRFISDLKTAKDSGFVSTSPCFASVGHFMEREDITPILKSLIYLSAMPLQEVETKFAIDSSGFRTSRYNEYLRVKHNLQLSKEHAWVKAHVCCGVKTNIVTAVEVKEGYSADINEFRQLAVTTHDTGFTIDEMSADKAYLSRANFDVIDQLGGTAFIPFKKNAIARAGRAGLWKKMYHYFALNRDDYLKHYHLRSNVETTFSMIKAKFSEMLKSKSYTAQVNELLLKILCHNIVVLIHEVNELGIKADFQRQLPQGI
jgi:transposase